MSIEVRIDKMVEQFHEVLEVRRRELISQLHQLAKKKLRVLETQKALLIDHLDNPCHLTQEIAPPLRFRLLPTEECVSELTEECWISESQYEITFTPTFKGLHYLHMEIDECAIKGSPFPIGVRSTSVKSLSNQISSIESVERPWGVTVNSKQNLL